MYMVSGKVGPLALTVSSSYVFTRNLDLKDRLYYGNETWSENYTTALSFIPEYVFTAHFEQYILLIIKVDYSYKNNT